MAGATKPRFALIFLMVLTLVASLGLPAEDVLETVYDELEALPYEDISLFLNVVTLAAVPTTQAGLHSPSLSHLRSPTERIELRFPFGAQPVHPRPDSSTIFNRSLRC